MSYAAPANPYWSGGFSLGAGPKAERKTREEFMFGSEPITGYRIWKIGKPSYDSIEDFLGLLADAHDAGVQNPYRHALAQTKRNLLMPIATTVGGAWLPGVTEARCTVHGHKAPDLQCECGFWALRDEAQLVQAFVSYQPDAWGTVKLWGRFCEFGKGYRAQHAYPERITLLNGDDALAFELATTYGCEVGCGDVPGAVTTARADTMTKQVAQFAASYLIQQHISASQIYAQGAAQLQYMGSLPQPKKRWQR